MQGKTIRRLRHVQDGQTSAAFSCEDANRRGPATKAKLYQKGRCRVVLPEKTLRGVNIK